MRSRGLVTSTIGLLLCGMIVCAGAPAAQAAEPIAIPLDFNPWKLALSPDGSRLYVSSPAGAIAGIDTATNTVLASGIAEGSQATDIVVSGDGTHLYVSYTNTDDVLELDAATGAVIDTIDLPEGTTVNAMRTSAGNTHIYLATTAGDGTGQVLSIETATEAVSASAPFPRGIQSVAVSPDGSRIYASTVENPGETAPPNTLEMLDPSTLDVVATTDLPGTLRISDMRVSPDGAHLYAAAVDSQTGGAQMLTYDSDLAGAPESVALPGYGTSLAVSPDGSRVYLPSIGLNVVSVIDTATNTALGTLSSGGSYPYDLQASPDGRRVYVADTFSNRVAVLEAPTLNSASLPDGEAGTAYQAQIIPTAGTDPLTFSATGLPPGLALDPTTGTLTGTPTTTGTFTITLTAGNLIGSATATFTLTVAAASPAPPAPPELPATGSPDPAPALTIALTLLLTGLALTTLGRPRRS